MYPFRFLGVGLFAVGIVLFAPFFFRFLLFAIIFGMAMRLIGGFHRARYGYGYGCGQRHHFKRHHHSFGPYQRDRYDEDGIVPSDY